MADYEKWDEYYDGGFATGEPFNSSWEEYYSILHLEYDELDYKGQKTNVTVEQIMRDMNVKAADDKFLYGNETVAILLDYSKDISDRWKKGTILYCNGERTYSKEKDISNLSIVDKMLYNAKSIDKIRVRVFWKDVEKNYRLINGLFMLSNKPYQIEEEGKYRWIFPLFLVSKYNFHMPEKYCFYVEPQKIKKIQTGNKNNADEIDLIEFNEDARFDFDKSSISYKRAPQKKNDYRNIQEKKARSRRIAENALILADFKCEIDEEHFTFIRKKQNVPYTEAHHLVPLAYSDQFRYSLDVEENIVSLCSSCHKRIHYGKDAKELIRRLFSNRKELLEEAGIIISEEELFNMYGIY